MRGKNSVLIMDAPYPRLTAPRLCVLDSVELVTAEPMRLADHEDGQPWAGEVRRSMAIDCQ